MRRFVRLMMALLAAASFFAGSVQAQDMPPQRQIRTYIPPDQLVSFLPSTPFNQFVEFLNPIMERVTGKTIVDPESISNPIGISIAGMHFFDAFELVLEYNELGYRETEQYFIVQPIEVIVPGTAAAGPGAPGAGVATAAAELPAGLASREIKINAMLFSYDVNRARQLGLDWNVFFGGETGAGSGGGEGLEGFVFDASDINDVLEPLNISIPNQFQLTELSQFFRLLETEGLGETVANPSVTVQSGEQGNIQIGTDLPYVTRDFAGNTIVQFVQTGIIVDVTPTLITEAVADTAGAPSMDFIHLDVAVENSNGQVTQAGPVVSKSQANTQVLLLDGEQTIIGGLYSTDEFQERRGIPLLKDLPGWFFGLRYIFGYESTTYTQRELLIVLQAEVLDPLELRAQRPYEQNLIDSRRRQIQRDLQRADAQSGEEAARRMRRLDRKVGRDN